MLQVASRSIGTNKMLILYNMEPNCKIIKVYIMILSYLAYIHRNAFYLEE